MFVDFNSVFKKNQQKLSVPESLLKYLSKSLPNGLRYEALPDGNCSIVAESGNTSYGDLLFKPTEEQKKILGEKYTDEDVLEYGYNAQQQLRFEPKDPNFLVINGQSVPIEDCFINPLTRVQLLGSSFYVMPKPFPDPFLISVESKKYKRILKIKRVANQSVYVYKFESDCNEPFVIEYFIDTRANTIQISTAMKLRNAHTVRDLVETTSIYNAFVDGTASIEGEPVQQKPSDGAVKRFDDKTIVFWEKVLKIEEVLGVSFIPPMEDIDFDTMCLVEQLYQSFAFQRPTIDSKRINSISGTWAEKTLTKPEDCIGKQLFMIFTGKRTEVLFGVELTLYFISGQCNAVVSDYKLKDKKYTIQFADWSVERHFFTAILYFENQDAMNSCVKNNTPLEERMHNAKQPSDYF